MSGSPSVGFVSYVDLFTTLLSRCRRTCERVERQLLNVRDKPASRIRERQYFDRALASCVFDELPRETAALAASLAAQHAADGFAPFLERTCPHQLDAAESIVRAYQQWDRTRWPGAALRQSYAQTIMGVFLLRHLQMLVLRIGEAGAPARLRTIQRLLDALNASLPSGALLRDARWLLQVAQGPLTKGLAPYFRVAEAIAASFTGADAIEIHAAGAKLAGGHLRSQARHRAAELRQPAESPAVLAVTRNSNSMDVALLVWDLIPLLEAYGGACAAGDGGARLTLADAILQGVSADPDLLLARLDLLGPCTTIETVFVDAAGSDPALTATGAAHAARLQRYGALVDDLAASLAEDAPAVDPASSTYSPLALVYGFCGDLLGNMALAPLRGQTAPDVALEDLFATGGDAARKEARAGMEAAPDWAHDVFARTRGALDQRARRRGRANASDIRGARLIVEPARDGAQADAQQYCVTSDVNLALSTGATAFPRGQIAIDRDEGRFLACVDRNGRWFGVSKIVLTEKIARGEDAAVAVPEEVGRILRITCPTLMRE